MFFGGTHFSSFLAQNGTLWGVIFAPGLTSSASFATLSPIEKRTKCVFWGGPFFIIFSSKWHPLGCHFWPRANIQCFPCNSVGDRKTPPKTQVSRTPRKKKKWPDVAFIQGLILFSALTYIDSVPKIAIWGTPNKSTFS